MSPHRPNKYCENALPVLKMVGDRREILSWLVGISVRASGHCVLARARWPVTWRTVGMACRPGFGDRPCLELPHCGECWRMLWQSLPALRRQLVPRRGGRTGSAAAAVATCRATCPEAEEVASGRGEDVAELGFWPPALARAAQAAVADAAGESTRDPGAERVGIAERGGRRTLAGGPERRELHARAQAARPAGGAALRAAAGGATRARRTSLA